jgi:hypothetical protein
MPIYTYRCSKCGRLADRAVRIADRNTPIPCTVDNCVGTMFYEFSPTTSMIIPDSFRAVPVTPTTRNKYGARNEEERNRYEEWGVPNE